MGVWIERVPSKDNIADDPSRCWLIVATICICAWERVCFRRDYHLLGQLGIKRVAPLFDPIFLEPLTWESLSVVNMPVLKRRRKA